MGWKFTRHESYWKFMEHTVRSNTQGTNYNETCTHRTFYTGLVSFRKNPGAMQNFDTEYAKACKSTFRC